MNCPGCGLYHPARYEQCVSCGCRFDGSDSVPATEQAAVQEEPSTRRAPVRKESSTRRAFVPQESSTRQAPVPQEPYTRQADPAINEPEDDYDDGDDLNDRRTRGKNYKQAATESGKSTGRKERTKRTGRKSIPLVGLTIAAGILLASAGGTFFFLSRPPESNRLLTQGQKELANGQYAFAQKTLEQAMSIRPNDPQILMSLARAYVGTDQVEKAWSCISLAQQSGPGLLTDPQLSSDLAKYYVQRNQYSRAAELLRPLADQNIPHKKTELADLDAIWGDECFNKGDTDQALKCWEEIKKFGEGSRFNEVDTRLATIYQKMSNELIAKDDIEGALKYLNNLNTIAPSPQSFEKSADLYSKQDKLDVAIELMQRAIKMGNGSRELNRKLAGFLSKRGKELLDNGNTDTGYAYLQQAQGYDSSMKVPTVALRSITVNVDNVSGTVRSAGEAWNPGPNVVAYLSIRTELYDTKSSHSIWSKDQKIVDEFVAPLQAKETRQFEFSGPLTGTQNGLELRVYLNGNLYKSYPLGTTGSSNNPAGNANPSLNNPSFNNPSFNNHSDTPSTNHYATLPTLNPLRQPPAPAQRQAPPAVAPAPAPTQATPNPAPGMTPEERTLKDLD